MQTNQASRLRFGVISTANIGLAKVIPAMQRGQHVEVVAIASRERGRADLAARRLGIPRAYGSYEALLDDPDVDAVYIPTPNHLHVPWSIRAIDAGKHVLVEKPVALNAGEAGRLRAAAARHPRLKVMEAFMYRFHPQWVKARELVTTGQIGELRTIQTFFSYFDDDPANVRNQRDIGGGGGLMDIGCYPISLSRWIFDAEPARVTGAVAVHPMFGVDVLTSGILEFDRGTATFTCGTLIAPYQRVAIFGTEGHVEIEIPFNALPDGAHRLWHHRGASATTHDVGCHDQYTTQGDLFARAVLDDTPVPTPLDDAVANMRVIDATFESARQGRWIEPAAES
jgi:predicted dehydrogenase